jgi:hypothetical protein
MTMASVRTEHTVIADPRYAIAAKLMKSSRFDVLGRMIAIWGHCTQVQSYYLDPAVIDTLAEFDGFTRIICDPQVALAEMTSDGVRIKGTKGRIEWLGKLKKASKKGGKARIRKAKRNPDGTIQPSSSRESSHDPAVDPALDPGQSSVLIPSLIPVPSPSLVLSKSKEQETAPQSVAVPEGQIDNSGARRFIATYVNAFRSKYGEQTKPDLSGKVQGEIKRFLKDTPIDRACSLIQVYFQMDDRWFETKNHDFTTFVSNLSKIGVALDTGKSAGGIDWDKFRKLVGESS